MLTADNISIRLIEKSDPRPLFQLVDKNRDRLVRYFPVTSKEISSLESCEQYVKEKMELAAQREVFVFAVVLKGELIGLVIAKNIDWGIPKCELAYFIDRDWEGQGMMSKALDLLIQHCFTDLEMHKIYICVSPENERSRRLPKTKGFQLEGVLRDEFRLETGRLVDVERYGLIKGEAG